MQTETAVDIHTRAMMVSLRISNWTARKLDKGATAEVHAKAGASDDAGLYTKRLLGKNAGAHKELIAHDQTTRTQHYEHTLPWTDDGQRLLPTKQYMEYAGWLRTRREERAALLNTFVETYPALQEQAKAVLGKLYDPSDYPSPEEVRGKFNLEAHFSPLPARGDFRVELPSEHIRNIETEVEKRIHDAVSVAMKDAWDRLYETVSKIHERLDDPKNIFRDSLIGNARDLCDILTRLNVTEDPQLEAMRQRVEEQLTEYEPIDLRTNPRIREDTAKKAKEILRDMRGIYGGM